MTSDAELLEMSRAGQRAAFATLVERYQNLVFATTLSGTGDRELAADLAQETFVAAWTSLPTLRDESRFRSWLCGIARNLVGKVRRSVRREASADAADLPEASPDALELLSREESETLVRGILDQMPEASREPLVLFYWEGRSAKEVAAQLGLSVSAVEQRLSRGRRHIRTELEGIVERTLASAKPKKGFAAVVLASIEGLPQTGAPDPSPELGGDPSPMTDVAGPAATGGGIITSRIVFALLAATALLAAGWVMLGRSGNDEPDSAVVVGAEVPPAAEARPEHVDNGAAASSTPTDRVAPVATPADAPPEPDPARSRWQVGPDLTMHEFPNRVVLNLLGGPSTMTPAQRERLEGGGALPYNRSGKVLDTPMRGVSGVVTDGEGNPVQGVAVFGGRSISVRTIRQPNPELHTQGGAMTDAQGRFGFEATTKGMAVAALHSEMGWSEVVRVAAGEADIEVELELLGHASIHGEVSYEGEPTQAYVSLIGEDATSEDGEFLVQLPTDEDGNYHHQVPPGRYLVVAIANLSGDAGWSGEQGPRVQAEADLDPGAATRLDLEFDKGVTVELRSTPPRSISYYVFPGARHETWADARAALGDPRSQATHVGATPEDEESFGVIHDVPAGPMTVCAATTFKKFAKPDFTECRHVPENPDPDAIVSVTFHPPPPKD